jgi:hypothetical protein
VPADPAWVSIFVMFCLQQRLSVVQRELCVVRLPPSRVLYESKELTVNEAPAV